VTRNHLLDASALLALIFDEPGAGSVAEVIDDSAIHAVNLAEVMRKLVSLGIPVVEVIARIEELNLELIEALGMDRVFDIARLAPEAKRLGLSLGDCVCLVVAGSFDVTAVTAERRWSEVTGRKFKILQIR
jgi:ribonuclease VapC